ncbi:MAG: hypothetical protein K0S38_616 [Candidatus Paceibacter sp.]|jgi:hypothetical protein|nr:hypothetical protein [Candidatus Paceibacter sp.]
MPKIFNHSKRVFDLTPTERATMLGLLTLEFLGTRREDFIRDLAEKDVVALLRKETSDGEIVGFSTLMTLDLHIQGRKVKAVFSGDTTVLPEYRTSGGIGIEIGRYFMKALENFPDYEIYYVLISKGWRTYKAMPFFFKHFAPKHNAPTSDSDQAIMDAFGRVKYPLDYDSRLGLIMFSRETQRLVPDSIDAIPPKDPDIHTEYFLRKNPTYLSGTELVCVAPVRVDNFSPPLVRLIKSAT